MFCRYWCRPPECWACCPQSSAQPWWSSRPSPSSYPSSPPLWEKSTRARYIRLTATRFTLWNTPPTTTCRVLRITRTCAAFTPESWILTVNNGHMITLPTGSCAAADWLFRGWFVCLRVFPVCVKPAVRCQYEQQEWLQQEKHLSLFIWAVLAVKHVDMLSIMCI